MKKIITILLAFAMLFAFIACDPVTDSKPPVDNNSGTGNNQTNKDPFANIASTLTVPVENLDDIDFTGTWDFMENMEYNDPELSSMKLTQKGYVIVAEDKVTITYTYLCGENSFVLEEDYLEFKAENENAPENYYQSIKFDDANKTVIAIGGKGALGEMSGESSLDEFLEYLSLDAADSVKANEAKTAFKADFGDEGYYIYIKR